MKIKIERPLLIIVILGMLVRIVFVLFGAKYYFNRENFFIDGDTQLWQACISNLIKHGTYTLDMHSNEYGYFGRMPGYSFFIGIFYLLSGQNWDIAIPLIAWTQVLLDFFVIILVYEIGIKIFNNKNIALILSALYTFYPFIIVWSPVVYSEFISIALLLLSINFFFHTSKKMYYLSGLFIGLAVLFRPQILLIVPVFLILLLMEYRINMKFIKKAFFFLFMFLIAYAPWPIRNYCNYKKVILTQDLRGIRNWDVDALAFMQYIFSVKAEWEPQFSQIIHNEKVEWPKEAFLLPGDSAKLERVTYLSQNCGSGFSCWREYWKAPVTENNCTVEIKNIFDQLRRDQIEKNSFNFWIKVPIQNLKKAMFKLSLYDTKTFVRKAASLLFVYRSVLILFGMAGLFLMFKQNGIIKNASVGIGLYFMFLYIALCAGTSPQFRNIEMRYFLPADILMLIPSAFVFNKLYERFFKKNKTV